MSGSTGSIWLRRFNQIFHNSGGSTDTLPPEFNIRILIETLGRHLVFLINELILTSANQPEVHRHLRDLHHGVDHSDGKSAQVDVAVFLEIPPGDDGSGGNQDNKREQVVGSHGVEGKGTGSNVNHILDDQQQHDTDRIGQAAD